MEKQKISGRYGYLFFYVYACPINQIAVDGQFRKIENDVVECQASEVLYSGYLYQNKTNRTQTFFPEYLSEKKGGYYGKDFKRSEF